MAYRNYSTAVSHIVSPDGQGDFTTIGAALTAAVSGNTIFVRPGTYTENPTLKAGVNIVGFTGDGEIQNVIINGNCTFTGAGTVEISDICLQTNSAAFLTVSGSAASVVNLNGCYLNVLNNNGISYTTSSSGAAIRMNNCRGNISSTFVLIVATSPGSFTMQYCDITNGNSGNPSTFSTTNVNLRFCRFYFGLTTSSTAALTMDLCEVENGITSNTITVNGTGVNYITNSSIVSGTASAISIGTGATLSLSSSRIDSTNTNAITGAGILNYGGITFTNTSSTINTTTQNPIAWTVPQGGTGLTAPGTSGNVLTSNGTIWTSSTPTAPITGTTTLHDVIIGNGTNSVTAVGPGTSGQLFQSGGASANPTYTTATYPSTTTVNQLLYSSSANVIAGLATANGGVFDTTATGVPQVDTTNFAVLSTGVQIKGNNTNTTPPAGFLGEQIRSYVATGSAVNLPTGTSVNVTSISLTAGIWDVSSICAFQNITTGTQVISSISTTSAILGGSVGDNRVDNPITSLTASDYCQTLPALRLLLASTTTVYLVAFAVYTGGTGSVYGRISATRVG